HRGTAAGLSCILPFAWLLGRAGTAARLECVVLPGHHECGPGLHRPCQLLSRFSYAFHHLLADFCHTVDVRFAHPLQHLLSRTFPHRPASSVDQVGPDCSPNRPRPDPVRCPVRSALSPPLYSAFSFGRRSAEPCGKRIRLDFSLCFHCRNCGQTVRRSCPRARCSPPPRGRGRRFGARTRTGARPACDLHSLDKNSARGGAFLGTAHCCCPVFPFSPIP